VLGLTDTEIWLNEAHEWNSELGRKEVNRAWLWLITDGSVPDGRFLLETLQSILKVEPTQQEALICHQWISEKLRASPATAAQTLAPRIWLRPYPPPPAIAALLQAPENR
jgi:hypothetical protein